MHHVEPRLLCQHRGRYQDVIERLRVPLVDVAVSLGGRQRFNERREPGALQNIERARKFEIVEVSEHHDARPRFDRQDLTHEPCHELCLRRALRL